MSKRQTAANTRSINLIVEVLFVLDSTVYSNFQEIYGGNIPDNFLNGYINIVYSHIVNGVCALFYILNDTYKQKTISTYFSDKSKVCRFLSK